MAKRKEPRVSTTDAEARVMKMADGGYRPAYNGQFASDPETQVIVALDIDTTGSDHGLIGLMQEQIGQTYGQAPKQYLVEGGFTKLEDIERAHQKGIEIFAPPPSNKHATDRFAPREDDGPGTEAWRKRMSSEEDKAVYRLRAKAECVNADLRNRGLRTCCSGGARKCGRCCCGLRLRTI